MTDAAPTARRTSIAKFVRDVAIIVVAAIVISVVIKAFLFRSFFIPSESMETTLMVNDRVIVNELVPDVMPLERGDVALDKSIEIYERGEALKKHCETLLTAAEKRIEKIRLDRAGKPVGLEPLDGE